MPKRAACVLASMLLIAGAAEAGARPHHAGAWHHHHHAHRGFFWGGALGFGLLYPPCCTERWVALEPVVAAPAEPLASASPDPVFVPQRGQDARRTEVDRRACNRQTMSQPSAMTDAATFHRLVLACMQEHGYAVE